jgi:hypothetical protein
MRSPPYLPLQGGEPALGPRPEGRIAKRSGRGSRQKLRIRGEAGAPPGAFGATLPLAGGGIHARHFAYAICSAIILAGVASTLMAQPAPPPAQQPQQPQQKLTIGFVDIEGDPRYEPIRGFERLILKTREHPFAGAEVGIDEAQALTRVLKTDFVLERITVKSADAVAPAVAGAGVQAAGGGGSRPRRARVRCERGRRFAAPRALRSGARPHDAEPRDAHGRPGAVSGIEEVA